VLLPLKALGHEENRKIVYVQRRIANWFHIGRGKCCCRSECNVYVWEAIRAAMTPTINSLMVVGLVSLSGMMTGRILGEGADPRQAVRYQIVMLMIAAAAAIRCLILVGLSYYEVFCPRRGFCSLF